MVEDKVEFEFELEPFVTNVNGVEQRTPHLKVLRDVKLDLVVDTELNYSLINVSYKGNSVIMATALEGYGCTLIGLGHAIAPDLVTALSAALQGETLRKLAQEATAEAMQTDGLPKQ